MITAQGKNTDFIEVDRKLLQKIGFKNTLTEKKDKHGNIKVDEHGQPFLSDMRNDFSNAIRSLRSSSFNEGNSFDESDVHFVVQKTTIDANKKTQKRHGGAGLNKLTLWVRKDMVGKWIHMHEIKGNCKKKRYNGLVYFIHMENNFNVFKIGYTTNLKKRLEMLQTAHPYLLQVYTTIENVSRKKETELHHYFNKKRIRGEWFEITPDMIDFVCNNKK